MWLKAIGFFLLSSVKFAVASLPIASSFEYYEALIISISGGIFGAFFFLFAWKKIFYIWNFYIIKKDLNQEHPFKITSKKRRLIRLKNSYGYWGIIFLTPIVLSIPVGSFFIMQYFKNKHYKFIHLSLVIAFWGLILISFFKFSLIQIFG